MPVLSVFSWLLGTIIYLFLGKRKRILLSNLSRAFPEKTRQWHKKIARESCQRMVEMGMLVLASPYFSKARIRKQFSIDDNLKELLVQRCEDPYPTVLLIPHFSQMDTLTFAPILFEGPIPETGVLYRPLDNPSLEDWVKETRQRFGVQMLSRKEGLTQALTVLKRGGVAALLFDQSAGLRGVLSTFFGRLSSIPELPGFMVEKFQADVHMVHTKRTAFWCGEICIEPLAVNKDCNTINIAANAWLENKLKENDALCADWLWLHDRWRCQDEPRWRFQIRAKKNILQDTLKFEGKQQLDKQTHFAIRLPNWLGDVVMALPLIRALRKARPDAHLTLLAQAGFIPLLESLQIAETIIPLPKKGLGYFAFFYKLRSLYPDTHILFTNSFRGDLEARIMGARQRFGIKRPGQKKRLLTHTWDLPQELDEAQVHQTQLWEKYFQNFGLEEPLDLTPFTAPTGITKKPKHFGLICGTENSPEKRWPITHWRALIKELLSQDEQVCISLFGTPRDTAITQVVAEGFPEDRVNDLAGKTDLTEFITGLCSCETVICNDTGGMHLANAFGVRVVAIFGPTNPVRTGPIFDGPTTLLQPKGCPKTGGMPIEQVGPEVVLKAANQ